MGVMNNGTFLAMYRHYGHLYTCSERRGQGTLIRAALRVTEEKMVAEVLQLKLVE